MGWTHLNDKVMQSKKNHICYLCNEQITIHECYLKRTGVQDKTIAIMKMHPECEKETHKWDDMDWECFFQGDMKRPTEKKEEWKSDPWYQDMLNKNIDIICNIDVLEKKNNDGR